MLTQSTRSFGHDHLSNNEPHMSPHRIPKYSHSDLGILSLLGCMFGENDLKKERKEI